MNKELLKSMIFDVVAIIAFVVLAVVLVVLMGSMGVLAAIMPMIFAGVMYFEAREKYEELTKEEIEY